MLLSAIQLLHPSFDLPLSLTLLAYFTFGVTGALAGLRRGYDVIGVFFLALITAGGGGILRDVVLLASGPSSLLTDGRYLIVVLVAAILTSLFHRVVYRLSRTIAMIDSLGLGAFAVIGVDRTLEAGLGIPAAIVGGTLTCVGGGLLRDVLVREEPLLFKPGQFYALVAIAGCGLYVGLLEWRETPPDEAAIITIVAVFLVRILAIRFNWRTSALSRDVEDPPPP